ncbi:uncharacterized protein FSUBG_8029 [Fusarium subglutinans]|uniref:Uncharacterized protein n=1 Tax=Gibberella subglutinans TaxID=42677 RepID=A0A8H5PS65_GIBSU|nr:uncharacterized protein FSUBG_8029 [Fusarium subglutinans]KAF5601664.1 hypothetical protein FSUBG_8029 [Fusarium subglutinans]
MTTISFELVTPPIPFDKASMPSTNTRIATCSSEPQARHTRRPHYAWRPPSATLSYLPFNSPPAQVLTISDLALPESYELDQLVFSQLSKLPVGTPCPSSRCAVAHQFPDASSQPGCDSPQQKYRHFNFSRYVSASHVARAFRHRFLTRPASPDDSVNRTFDSLTFPRMYPCAFSAFHNATISPSQSRLSSNDFMFFLSPSLSLLSFFALSLCSFCTSLRAKSEQGNLNASEGAEVDGEIVNVVLTLLARRIAADNSSLCW